MTTPAQPVPPSRRVNLTRFLGQLGPLIGLAFVYILFASLQFDTFASWNNFVIMLQQTAVIGIGAIGMTFVIISGGIDLSVGSIVAFGSVVLALLLQAGWSPLWAAIGCIVASGLCGAITGLFVTRLKLIPFIVTLAMMSAVRGGAKGLANQQPIYPDSTWLNKLMLLGSGANLPIGVWLMIVLAVLAAIMLRYTRFGRHVVAVGSNEQTARLCGVPVERVILLVYIFGTVMTGIAAVLQFAYLTGGDPTTANGMELNIIAAVVIGGASLTGGQGSIAGSIVGALIMTVVANGCTKMGLANWVQQIVTGGIILLAILLDNVRHGQIRIPGFRRTASVET